MNETADDAYMRRAMLSQQQTDSLKSAQDIARQVADKLTAEQGLGLYTHRVRENCVLLMH